MKHYQGHVCKLKTAKDQVLILLKQQKHTLEVFYKKCVLKYFTQFTEKHLCQGLIFSKVASANLLKKSVWRRCFPVNFVKFLRTPPNDCFWNNATDNFKFIVFPIALEKLLSVFQIIFKPPDVISIKKLFSKVKDNYFMINNTKSFW